MSRCGIRSSRAHAQLCSRLMEAEIGVHRSALLSGLSGRVLEIGAGNGMNFRHYPSTVDEVSAVEPEPYLRACAIRSASEAAVKVTVLDGLADALPFEDGDFDAAVACQVLCTVPDQQAALAELRRVLAPVAELRFLEHVRSRHPLKARVQRATDASGIWSRLAGVCHCARDTVGTIAADGFEIELVHDFDRGSRPARGTCRFRRRRRRDDPIVEQILDPGPIPYTAIVLYGDPDLEQGLRHYGVDPGASSYRLIEVPVASITDTASMPHPHWDHAFVDLVRSGVELPPIVVFRKWRGSGWGLLDGVARTHAFLACGVERTPAYEVTQRPQ